ncbi:response regulator transcription factor [Trebonia sp.]|uniref:response regulator transcription factor n=1 Tax=Trebonia sp. TaxID=2767075 RepID=UPI002630B9EE|nr:response regulator transcription factor [Trebonia sp.]
MPSVLVADHEPEVAEMARRYLARARIRALVTCTPAQTLRGLADRSADLFVIDLTMPGLEVRRLRQVLAPGVPAVFLLHGGDTRPYGLNAAPAARRWLTRPFSPRSLLAAVCELLQPVPPTQPGHDDGGHGTLAASRREIVVNGRDVSLSRTEFALMSALAGQPGRVLSRQRLLAALESERGKRPSPRAIDVYIAQLRAKLGMEAIRTIHGVGYVLDVDAPPAANGPPARPAHPGQRRQREGMA